MNYILGLIPDITLDTANRFYAFGWTASLSGAAITFIGVIFLMWGTRVRDIDFEHGIATLNNEAAAARERAGELDQRAAELERGNISLQRDLERERTERLKLEERQKPRTISGEQRAIILTELKASPKGRVEIRPKMWDPEAGQFAAQVASILNDAGFEIKGPEPAISYGILGSFLVIRDSKNRPAHFEPIYRAFEAAGIRLSLHREDYVDNTDTVWFGISSKP